MSHVVLLGAGASRGTLGESAPTSADFGEYLNRDRSIDKYPYLKAAVEFFQNRIAGTSVKSWALDKVWGAIDNRVKLRYILGPALSLPNAPRSKPRTKKIYRKRIDDFGLAGFELKCAVARVYGKSLDSEIRKAVQKHGSLSNEFGKLNNGDCVISFNYDLLAEKILEKDRSFITANPYLNVSDERRGILLVKPHGSLSWKIHVPEKGYPPEILQEPIAEKQVDDYPEIGAEVQPGIVAPVPYKEQIIVPEIQSDVRCFFWLVVEQWKAAIRRISQASEITVMGFGFPSEDLHAKYLFAEAAALRNTARDLGIHVYQKKEDYENVHSTLMRLFGNPSIDYMGPVKC